MVEDEALPSPAQSDDGSAIDQAASSNLRLSDNGGRVVGALAADAMKAQARGGGGVPTRGAEPPSRAMEHDQQGAASSRVALSGALSQLCNK